MERKTNTVVKFSADELPRIANRSDALELLDVLIEADCVVGDDYALTALRDAIEREIIYPLRGRAPGFPPLSLFWKPPGPYGSPGKCKWRMKL
jgi:hypothetical protein